MRLDPRISLVYILHNQRTDLHILLAITGFALSLGFAIGVGNNANYDLIFSFSDRYYWAIMFFVYASIKLYGAFNRINRHVRFLNSIFGLWAWNYIFLSFTVFDATPVAPTELLLAVPTVIEVWTMLAAPFKNAHRRIQD